MSVALTVTFLALTVTQVLSTQPTNCSSRNEGISVSGGVCKADYGSRFNIDSKELMGTTCVTGNSGINKLLSARLKQALERMKQDFQQLQELIDQEVALSDTEPVGAVRRSGSLNVHRDYQKEEKSGGDKERFYNEPSIGTNEKDVLDNQGQGIFHPQVNFYGQTGLYYDNSSKKIPSALENRPEKDGINSFMRESYPKYNSRSSFDQQRILETIRVEPEINVGHGNSADDLKEKNTYAGPEFPIPALSLNPNFGF